MKNKPNKKTRTDKVYKVLKEKIFLGHYLPRERLIESSLSKDLGVSRVIVRDILNRLCIEGLVRKEAYKGCRVEDVSLENVLEAYEVEAALEGFAAFIATDRITDKKLEKLKCIINESKNLSNKEVEEWEQYNREIHRLINKASGNSILIKLIRDNLKFSKYSLIILSTSGEMHKRNEEHAEILEALLERNNKKARELVESHIMNAANDLKMRMQDMRLITLAG